jgi:hypothetical protein
VGVCGRAWHCDVYGSLAEGTPVFVHKVGAVDPEALLAHFTTEQVQRHYIRDLELLSRRKVELSKDFGRRIYKHWCGAMRVRGLTSMWTQLLLCLAVWWSTSTVSV